MICSDATFQYPMALKYFNCNFTAHFKLVLACKDCVSKVIDCVKCETCGPIVMQDLIKSPSLRRKTLIGK